MPTTNRSARHNFHWHSRPANDPIGFIGDIEYTYNLMGSWDYLDMSNQPPTAVTNSFGVGAGQPAMFFRVPVMPQDHSCMTLTRSPPIGRPRHPTPATTIPTASILCTRV